MADRLDRSINTKRRALPCNADPQWLAQTERAVGEGLRHQGGMLMDL